MPTVRVPDDTQSLHNIGDFIMSYTPYQNAFLSALVNRIGRVLVTSRIWENPWAVFKRGRLDMGETVEEIFVNIAKPHSFDPAKAESEVFKREIPDVRAAFHTMNFQKFYKATISNDQLRQAFLAFSEISGLIARIVDSLYTGLKLDHFLVTKYMTVREALNGGMYVVNTPAVGTDPEGVVEKFREYTNNLTFLKSIYNRAHVRNFTPVSEQVIIVPNAVEAAIGVKVLANAFNINEADYISKRIPVDSFTFDADDTARLAEIFENDPSYKPLTEAENQALQQISAIKVSRNWFMIFDNYQQFTENYNGQGLYWQYFYHYWGTFSVSPFENALCFSSQTSSITGVTVSPASSNVVVGTSLQPTATVAGTGLFDKTVSWSMTSTQPTASGTTIDGGTGLLHVAADETVGNVITVTATSVNGQTGTCKVTVTAASAASSD